MKRHYLAFAFAILTIVAQASRAETQPTKQKPPVSFAKAVTYDADGSLVISVAVADLNGDGIPDLVVADGDSNFVSVLLGNGDGTFRRDGAYDSGGSGADSVAIADINGDGFPDLVVANFCLNLCDGYGAGEVSVLLGNGDGTFQSPLSYISEGDGATSVAIADVNGDGNLDVVVASYCDSSCSNNGVVSVLLGNGDGTFQQEFTYSSGGYGADSVAISDVNGDGYLDLVVANQSGNVGVLLGNGNGTFQTSANYSSGGLATSVAIADVNGDGIPDLVVANLYSSYNSGTVGVLLGNGDGTFQPAVIYSSGGYYGTAVAIGDMNGDGYPDLVVANECQSLTPKSKTCVSRPSEIGVLLGNGNGTFEPAISFDSGGSNFYFYDSASIAIADLNGDGKPDLAVPNSGSDTVGILLNNFTAKTTSKITSSPNPSQLSQPVTFTATVTSSSAVPDGSTITFYNGATEIGTGTTTDGIASLTSSFSGSGKYVIKASYPGDAFHKASSGTVKQVVNQSEQR